MHHYRSTPSIPFQAIALMVAILALRNAPTALGQTGAKNRQDERRENEQVEKSRRELSQTQSELKKLHSEMEQKSRAFIDARIDFLTAKKKSEAAMEEAEERLGNAIGLPEQMQTVRRLSIAYQEKAKFVVDRIQHSDAYQTIVEKVTILEEGLSTGIHPETEQWILTDSIDDLESSLANLKKELQAMEEAAVNADPAANVAFTAWKEAVARKNELKHKLDASLIDNDPAYKKAKTECDTALRKMKGASDAMKKVEIALHRKAAELGDDQRSYLKAKQADAADPNRTNNKKKSSRNRK